MYIKNSRTKENLHYLATTHTGNIDHILEAPSVGYIKQASHYAPTVKTVGGL